MSEAGGDDVEVGRARRRRRKSVGLPTPPPDPAARPRPDDEQEADRALLEYLDALQKCSATRTTPSDGPRPRRRAGPFAPAAMAEDAFDHLDKLYKLIEQLLNLRDQNAKLQRRVRDLEHVRALQAMHQHVTTSVLSGTEPDIPDVEDDASLADALETMFGGGDDERRPRRPTIRRKLQSQFRFRQPSRTESTTTAAAPERHFKYNRCGSLARKSAKVSKWTKVKAAFRWEKASPSVTGAKSQDSGIGGMLPLNNELARYLRVPSNTEAVDGGPSPAESVAGHHGLSTPGTLSSASSAEDVMMMTSRAPSISDQRSVSRSDSNNVTRQDGTTPNSDDDDDERKDKLASCGGGGGHRSPWGKVKDILHSTSRKDSLHRVRGSRLSARSEDLRQWCSDQEEEAERCREAEPRAPMVTVTGASDLQLHRTGHQSRERLPAAVVARYRQVSADAVHDVNQVKEATTGSPRTQRRVSKWTKVKKAFLTGPKAEHETQSVPTTPTRPMQFFAETGGDERSPRRKTSQDETTDGRRLKAEIYKNYEQLQHKLTHEFQEKLHEWDRVKSSQQVTSNSAGAATPLPVTPSSTSSDDRDAEFARKMEEWDRIKGADARGRQGRNREPEASGPTSEQNLPPDFRKKLHEWQRIKGTAPARKDDGNSPRRKITDWQLWPRAPTRPETGGPSSPGVVCTPQLSDDFLKKLDEWKQIKAAQYELPDERRRSLNKEVASKTPSPNLIRGPTGVPERSSLLRQSKKCKVQEDKELQWLEKELQKIEKEKQRLEREREKFLEREDRLSKLRKSLDGESQKKDEVLVQTSTGFFRFEGISRKFTQKLYEWEKARGISPEDSTLVLLNPGFKPLPETEPVAGGASSASTTDAVPTLKLHRSKSADSVVVGFCEPAAITQQPSSLSLNDMEEFEVARLADDERYDEEELDEEPEAVIVEVEDLVEETAAPLDTRRGRHCTPVYRTSAAGTLCESERCEAPQVRRGESTTVSSYNLIREAHAIIGSISGASDHSPITDASEERQSELGRRLLKTLLFLQDATQSCGTEEVQDLTVELVATAEKLKGSLAQATPEILEMTRTLSSKLTELRRILSYVCAASDATAPKRNKSLLGKSTTTHHQLQDGKSTPSDASHWRPIDKTTPSDASHRSPIDKTTPSGASHRNPIEMTTPSDASHQSPIDNHSINVEGGKVRSERKLLRTRRISDSYVGYEREDRCRPADVIIPTSSQFVDAVSDGATNHHGAPASVFVRTTRKVFATCSEGEATEEEAKGVDSASFVADEAPVDSVEEGRAAEPVSSQPQQTEPKLPPAPSPTVSQRRERTKETSPAIRLMIARYNQKIGEQDAAGTRSGNSSGSASPVAWRSPVLERRVRAQTEKYLEGLNAASPLAARKNVQKSASAGVIQPKEVPGKPIRSILKSTSVDCVPIEEPAPVAPEFPVSPELQERAVKIQRAKERFLRQGSEGESSGEVERNRLSCGSESSVDYGDCSGLLVKSASAGMIHVDAQTYQQFEPEVHDGYVSLPRPTNKTKDAKFGICSLTSRFRKVRMRRNKDAAVVAGAAQPEMGTVSTLCRQSLVVDITRSDGENVDPQHQRQTTNKPFWSTSKIFRQK